MQVPDAVSTTAMEVCRVVDDSGRARPRQGGQVDPVAKPASSTCAGRTSDVSIRATGIRSWYVEKRLLPGHTTPIAAGTSPIIGAVNACWLE